MKHRIASYMLLVLALVTCLVLVGCGPSVSDLKDLREVSWQGKEVTVKVGENKSTGCIWMSEFENDKIVGYSISRTYTPLEAAEKEGISAGTLCMGFEGRSPGTARVYCATKKDWDGNEPGYSFAVVVTVQEGGTIASAAIE